jgi:hypothetical protein
MAIVFVAPGIKRKHPYNYDNLGINDWWNPKDVQHAYRWRISTFLQEDIFEANVLDNISDYFSPFRSLFLDLYRIIFGGQSLQKTVGVRQPINNSPATHSSMVDVLEKMKEVARRVERRPPPAGAQSYSDNGPKGSPPARKRNDPDGGPDSLSKSAGKKRRGADGGGGNQSGRGSGASGKARQTALTAVSARDFLNN